MAVTIYGNTVTVQAIRTEDARAEHFGQFVKRLKDEMRVEAVIHHTDSGTRYLVENVGLYSQAAQFPADLSDYTIELGRGVDADDLVPHARLLGLIVAHGADGGGVSYL